MSNNADLGIRRNCFYNADLEEIPIVLANNADLGIRSKVGPAYSPPLSGSPASTRAATIAGATTIPTNANAINKSCMMAVSDGSTEPAAAYKEIIAPAREISNPTNTESNNTRRWYSKEPRYNRLLLPEQ